jgi:hypothetical protein
MHDNVENLNAVYEPTLVEDEQRSATPAIWAGTRLFVNPVGEFIREHDIQDVQGTMTRILRMIGCIAVEIVELAAGGDGEPIIRFGKKYA